MDSPEKRKLPASKETLLGSVDDVMIEMAEASDDEDIPPGLLDEEEDDLIYPVVLLSKEKYLAMCKT